MHNSAARPWNSLIDMLNLRYLLACILTCVVAGCASQSSKAIASIDTDSPNYASPACQNARHNAWIHAETQNAKLWAGPSAVLLLGPAAIIPMFVTNVGVNTADYMQANDIAANCGGHARPQQEVNQNILVDATVSLAVGSVVPAPTK